MTLRYFNDCHTIEELKKKYKQLMLKYHPDINPDALNICQEINAEYDYQLKRLQEDPLKWWENFNFDEYKYYEDDENDKKDKEERFKFGSKRWHQRFDKYYDEEGYKRWRDNNAKERNSHFEGKTNNAYEYKDDNFKDIINQIIGLKGIEIEIIGSWIWVTGDTKQHKEKLKELKFKWNRNKSAWFYSGGDYRKRNGNSYSMDDIRSMYGSKKVR